MEMSEFLRAVSRARTLSTSGRWPEAAAVWESVVETNPVNGNYWDRLAEARFEAGDHAGALTAYRKVLELGAWSRFETALPADVEYEIARCHAALGDADASVGALARAVGLGYRHLDRPLADEHLAAIRDDPRVREVLGLPVTDGLSRDEGWRADLRFLAREIARRAPGPTRHEPRPHVDAAVADLDAAIPGLTDTQVVLRMAAILASLGDGHAYLDLPEDPALRATLPIGFYLFAEGLFVIAATPGWSELLGAQVLAVDGRPVDEVRAAVDPLISRDNPEWPKEEVVAWLRRPAVLHALDLATDPGSLTLRLRLRLCGAAGERTEREVRIGTDACAPWTWSRPCPPGWVSFPDAVASAGGEPVPAYLRNSGVLYWYDDLRDHDLVHVQINNIAEVPGAPLERFHADAFRAVDRAVERSGSAALILDLRWNTGGNTFLAMALLREVLRRDRLCRRGGLFVVVGRRTFSAAQNTATLLWRHTEAVFVGEPTGSSPNFVGETVPFRLPCSGLEANVSDLYWQTSWPMDHRTSIAPDLYAPPTFADYRANRDPALAAILAYRGEHLVGW